MDRTLIIIFTVAIAVVLLFVLPLMAMAERTDDITQQTVQSATTEFVNDIVTTGKITKDKYDDFIQTLNATGNTYNVELKVDVLDENVGKKTAQTQQTKIGENVYYTVYTNQIEEELASTSGVYTCQKGDIVSVDVKNTNTTIAQIFTSAFYAITGNDSYSIAASDSGIVTGKGSSSSSVSAKTATTTDTTTTTTETSKIESTEEKVTTTSSTPVTSTTTTTTKEESTPKTETCSECDGAGTRELNGPYHVCSSCGWTCYEYWWDSYVAGGNSCWTTSYCPGCEKYNTQKTYNTKRTVKCPWCGGTGIISS